MLSSSVVLAVTMSTPSLLTGVSLSRGSRQNGGSTSYTFVFVQPQPIA